MNYETYWIEANRPRNRKRRDMVRWHDAGLSYEEIAERLNHTVKWVRQIIRNERLLEADRQRDVETKLRALSVRNAYELRRI